jgi:uncharacterized membrane protein
VSVRATVLVVVYGERKERMNKRPAAWVLLGICLVLAILLFTKVITPVISGCIFALALVVLGGLSQGFRK